MLKNIIISPTENAVLPVNLIAIISVPSKEPLFLKINPTPAVGVIGVEDIENIRTLDIKNEGDKIILIGKTYDELSGSEYHRTVHNIEKGRIILSDVVSAERDEVIKRREAEDEAEKTAYMANKYAKKEVVEEVPVDTADGIEAEVSAE